MERKIPGETRGGLGSVKGPLVCELQAYSSMIIHSMRRKISMKPKKTFIVVLVSLGLSLMFAISAVQSATGDSTKGKQVFQQFCQVCHGAQGKGDGPVGMALKPPPANLSSDRVQNKKDDELMNILLKGKPGTAMPAWEKDLSSQQMTDVIAFIRSLGQ